MSILNFNHNTKRSPAAITYGFWSLNTSSSLSDKDTENFKTCEIFKSGMSVSTDGIAPLGTVNSSPPSAAYMRR